MNFLGFNLADLLIRIPPLLLALSMHELAHGYIAMKLGDPTARNLGRLTLNPLRHIDPIGAVCMLLFRFGWAKPVPVNSRYFKNPRRDMALTALAGPVSNFLMALIGMFLYRGTVALFLSMPEPASFWLSVEEVVVTMFFEFAILNISLGVFNLIPVPPLDGSRIFLTFLPPKLYFGLMKYERYIMLVMFVALYLGVFSRPLSFLVANIYRGMDSLVALIPIFNW